MASNAAGASLAWSFYKQNFERIKAMLSKASPFMTDAAIVNSISRFCTHQQADDVEAFFAAHPMPTAARRISQTLEVIRNNAAMVQTIAASALSSPEYYQR